MVVEVRVVRVQATQPASKVCAFVYPIAPQTPAEAMDVAQVAGALWMIAESVTGPMVVRVAMAWPTVERSWINAAFAVETTVHAPVVWMETPAIMMQQRLFRTVHNAPIPPALKWIVRAIAS